MDTDAHRWKSLLAAALLYGCTAYAEGWDYEVVSREEDGGKIIATVKVTGDRPHMLNEVEILRTVWFSIEGREKGGKIILLDEESSKLSTYHYGEQQSGHATTAIQRNPSAPRESETDWIEVLALKDAGFFENSKIREQRYRAWAENLADQYQCTEEEVGAVVLVVTNDILLKEYGIEQPYGKTLQDLVQVEGKGQGVEALKLVAALYADRRFKGHLKE